MHTKEPRYIGRGYADLTGKIDRCTGWGSDYIDSYGPYNTPPQAYDPALLRQVVAAYPDILLIPEGKAPYLFSAGYPWMDRVATRQVYSGSGSTPQAAMIWPTAANMMRVQNGGEFNMGPTTQYYQNAVAVMKTAYNKGGPGGDCIIAQCYSGTPTEFEQAAAIWQGIANGTL
jgi:hypothetical protein